jgi:hypothetical protein
MTRPTLALTALLCACSGQVTTYQSGPGGGSHGGSGAGGDTVLVPTPATTVDAGPDVAPEAGPEPGPPCDGDAMCWPEQWCDDGHCEPQGAAACLDGSVVVDCGPLICCCLPGGSHNHTCETVAGWGSWPPPRPARWC